MRIVFGCIFVINILVQVNSEARVNQKPKFLRPYFSNAGITAEEEKFG